MYNLQKYCTKNNVERSELKKKHVKTLNTGMHLSQIM